MVKKFRNTKARRNALSKAEKINKQLYNKLYYQKQKHGLDFSSGVNRLTKRDLNKLPTKEIQKYIKQINNIVSGKNKDFFAYKEYQHQRVPLSMIKKMREYEIELKKNEQELDKKRGERNIIIERNTVVRDTVLDRKLMSRPNKSLIGNLKPYDFNRAKSSKDIERALNARKKRLDPEWIRGRQQQMMDNFRYSLVTYYNNDEMVDSITDLMDRVKEIEGLLDKIDASDFYELYEQFDELDFSYIPSNQTVNDFSDNTNLQYIHDILSDFLDGQIDNRGKVFNND